MANIQDAIIIGDVHTNILDPITGKSVNYKEVTTYYDGTSMDTSKVDGNLYRRKGTKFLRKVIDKDGELFLEKDTMTQLRALTEYEILLLKAGVFKGVKLNGYYEQGDTPLSIEYYLSTSIRGDDGGSIIVIGSIKLEHNFCNLVNVLYFGAKGDGITDDTVSIQNAMNTGVKKILASTPQAFYKVTSLRMAKSQELHGDGMFNRDVIASHAVIQGNGVDTTIIIGEPTGRLRYCKLVDISIHNEGGKTVDVDYSPNWEILRSYISNRTGIAVDIRYSWRGSCNKSFLSGGGTAFRAMDNINGLTLDGNTITGGRGGRAVSIGMSQNVSITNNIIEASLHGIWVGSTIEETNSGTCMGIKIESNYFEQCSTPIVLGNRFTVLAFSIKNNFLSNGQSTIISERTAQITLGRVEGGQVIDNAFLMDTRGNEDLFHFSMINNERNVRNTTIRNNSFGSPARPDNYYKLVGEFATNSALTRLLGGDSNDFDFSDRFDGINSSEIREWISPVFKGNESFPITKWIKETNMRCGGRIFTIEIIDKKGDINGCKLSVGINSNINSLVNTVDIGLLPYTNGISDNLITTGNNSALYATEANLYRITASALETSTGTFRIKIRYKGN